MRKYGKLIRKNPVYVCGESYGVTVREVSIHNDYTSKHYYKVRFYKDNDVPFIPKVSYNVDFCWGDWETKNYKKVILKAIEYFEKDIDKKCREQNNLDDLTKWNGKNE